MSVYQPAKVYPLLVGAVGSESLEPEVTLVELIELPPLVLKETVYVDTPPPPPPPLVLPPAVVLTVFV